MKSVEIGKYEVVFSEDVLDLISKYKQKRKKHNESGGILLGQVKNDKVYILKASIPNSKDKSSRVSFLRNKEYAQHIIDYEFANSQGKTIYLGEWHTHPESYPTPSVVDIKMVQDQFEQNTLNEQFLVLFIQGKIGSFIGIQDTDQLQGININGELS